MVQPRTIPEKVSHAVRGYHRGVIGPSLMWLSIADLLTPSTATAVLDSLPQEVKEQLLSVYCERPPHAYIVRFPLNPEEEDFRAVCVQVVLWCESNGPVQEVPTQPDGLIRVCVEGDFVREWRPWEQHRTIESDAARDSEK